MCTTVETMLVKSNKVTNNRQQFSDETQYQIRVLVFWLLNFMLDIIYIIRNTGAQTRSSHLQRSPFRIGHVSLPILRLATSQKAMFLLNSRQGLFIATRLIRYPFYRRYGANLQSSLWRINSRALEYSSRIPVSVCGTNTSQIPNEDFPGNLTSTQYPCALAQKPN